MLIENQTAQALETTEAGTTTDSQAIHLLPPEESTAAPSEAQPGTKPVTEPATKSDSAPRPQRPLRNYVGIGGSIGVSGLRTGLNEGGGVIVTKNGLNDFLSIRGITVFGSSRTDNTLALTVDLPIRGKSGSVQVVPFVGGGVLMTSKYNLSDLRIRGLVTGGVDVPLSRRFTATASVNAGFTSETNVGVQLGIAYNY
jgi:hypothetical protein